MSSTRTTAAEIDEHEALSLLMPLHFFYTLAQRPWPRFSFAEPPTMPENERELLVHHHDMTSTLSAYHQSAIGLSVIERQAAETCLMRLVVLERERSPRLPVECGAIAIYLDRFSDHARELVLSGTMPLGAILHQEDQHYHSDPKGFFKVKADDYLADLLAEKPGTTLWGRCNSLSFCDGEVFADIVEILPHAYQPVPPSVHQGVLITQCGSNTNSTHHHRH
jgi:chorismate-pyruvate lyase